MFAYSLVNFPFVIYAISFLKDLLVSILKSGPVPGHVAFVMDGNRRFAKVQGVALKEGHKAGAETLASVLDTCYKAGVKACTIYAFSIENFNRSEEEVNTLFDLLRNRLIMLSNSDPASYLFDVKIKIVGNKTMIPAEILVDLEKIEEKTARHTNKILNVCFPYTSRDDIAHSVSTIVDRVKNGEMQTVDITEQALDENMYFGTDSPKMDILIRTSGHTRLSDFMTWQCHDQSMIEFVNVLWPDFNFVSIFWVLFKWGYYKSLILEDTQVMQPNKFANEGSVPNFKHPPFASVSEV